LSAAVLVVLPLLAGVVVSIRSPEEVEKAASPPGMQPVSPDSTVVLDGKAYTCESVANLVERCTREGQLIFDEYKKNLVRYAESDQLGFLNAEGITTKTYVGLVACVFQQKGDDENVYIDYILTDPLIASKAERSDLGKRASLLPAWFAASKLLCPGVRKPRLYGDKPLPP